MTVRLTTSIPSNMGERLNRLARELYPLNRSITGQGVRDTLRILNELVPMQIHGVPTGTKVFDWVIPDEWNLKEAYIEGQGGERIVDAKDHNLHVVSYSVPISRRMTLDELKQHVHTIPEHPDWIPYRTSYYKRDWGFCLSQRQMQSMVEGEYYVHIDSSLAPGVLNFGEIVIRGQLEEEFLISAHVCHPSLANDNLSGIAIAAWLAHELANQTPRLTYRIVFAPGTIGAITWLALNEKTVRRIKHGLVVALLGRPGPITYKRSRQGDSIIDRSAEHVLRLKEGCQVIEFSPWGYDERQFNSPGLNLNVGRLTRAPEGAYPEYHTSADDLQLITSTALADAFQTVCEIVELVDANVCYENLCPIGEPQLGKYGLYDGTGGARSVEIGRLALLWVLNLSDGHHSLLDVADRSGLLFEDITLAAERLERAGLLKSSTG